jgi:hypothetical protein
MKTAVIQWRLKSQWPAAPKTDREWTTFKKVSARSARKALATCQRTRGFAHPGPNAPQLFEFRIKPN